MVGDILCMKTWVAYSYTRTHTQTHSQVPAAASALEEVPGRGCHGGGRHRRAGQRRRPNPHLPFPHRARPRSRGRWPGVSDLSSAV